MTKGKAFFQNDCQVVVCFCGIFLRLKSCLCLKLATCWTSLANLSTSCNLAGQIVAPAGAAVVLYASVSDTVPAFEYQCSGSARWLVDNLDEYYSRKAASTPTEHPGPASIC